MLRRRAAVPQMNMGYGGPAISFENQPTSQVTGDGGGTAIQPISVPQSSDATSTPEVAV